MSPKDLPEGWAVATVDELVDGKSSIVDGPFGSNLKTEHYTDSGPRVIRLQNIGDGRFIEAAAHISQERFEQLSRHDAQPGDVVVASLGELLPRACLVPPTLGPAIVKADCLRIRPTAGIHPAYIMHFLNSPGCRAAGTALIRGIGRPRLNLADLRSVRVPIAPTEEQVRVVEELERRLSHIAAAESALSAGLRKLQLARSAIEAELLWAPGLKVVPLRDILQPGGLANGKSVPDREGGFPVLRLTCMKNGVVDLRERKPGAWTRDEAESFLVQAGDFFVVRGNGSLNLVGRGARLVDEPDAVAYPDTLIRVRVDQDKMRPDFLALTWNSPKVRQQIEAVAHTTAGIYKVNQKHLSGILLPCPDLATQEVLVRETSRRLAQLDRSERVIQGQLRRCSRVRASVLNAAFTGELVPQDPSDEPASVLLGRIKEQRAATQQAKMPARRPRAKKETAP